MSIMETLNTRRTYRRFAQKPVPQDVVDDMVEALRLSSCGANRQAVKLVVVQSPEMVKKVHPLVKWAAYLPPEQGAPKADEQPVMYLAVVQDSSIPGDLNTDTGIALANITLAAWAKGGPVRPHGPGRQAPERAAGHRRAGQAGVHGSSWLPHSRRQGRTDDGEDRHQVLPR